MFGREGLPHGDEGGGRVHHKGGAMDSVHGRDGVTKAEKATVQTGRWDIASEQGPLGDVACISGCRSSS